MLGEDEKPLIFLSVYPVAPTKETAMNVRGIRFSPHMDVDNCLDNIFRLWELFKGDSTDVRTFLDAVFNRRKNSDESVHSIAEETILNEEIWDRVAVISPRMKIVQRDRDATIIQFVMECFTEEVDVPVEHYACLRFEVSPSGHLTLELRWADRGWLKSDEIERTLLMLALECGSRTTCDITETDDLREEADWKSSAQLRTVLMSVMQSRMDHRL